MANEKRPAAIPNERPHQHQWNDETDEDQNNTKGIAEVIIAKHRNGSVGTVKTRFINELAKFIDIDNSGTYSGSDFPSFNNPIAENRSFIQASSKMNNEEIDIDPPPF